jgi:hypothetical protein
VDHRSVRHAGDVAEAAAASKLGPEDVPDVDEARRPASRSSPFCAKVRAVNLFPSLAALAIVLAASSGCGTSLGGFLRRHTYPPDFRYVSEEKFRSSMWLLGRETLELHRVLADASLSESTRRTRADLMLGGMEETVRKIGPEQWSSNHPELQSGLQALESDLHAARVAVSHDPPNYFLAGSISGACLYCHSR